MRSEKNKLGYGILLNLSALGFGAAGAYLSKGKTLGGSYQDATFDNEDVYGPDGQLVKSSRRVVTKHHVPSPRK